MEALADASEAFRSQQGCGFTPTVGQPCWKVVSDQEIPAAATDQASSFGHHQTYRTPLTPHHPCRLHYRHRYVLSKLFVRGTSSFLTFVTYPANVALAFLHRILGSLMASAFSPD
jgi:hypothetical protein